MKPMDFIDHPEGGRFCEVFRSTKFVTTGDGNTRSALTHIYFSLNPGEVSYFHRLASDEVWSLYHGNGLKLYTWDGTDNVPECKELSAVSENFCHIVQANTWLAAEPLSGPVLVGCSVAPGFEYSDFEMLDSKSDEGKWLLSNDPNMARFLGN